MRTEIVATRLSNAIPDTGYTVLLRTSGAGNVDISIWLTDAEALQLATQLCTAVAQQPATEAAS